MRTLLIVVTVANFFHLIDGVDIAVDQVCGRSLPTCPNKIGLKVVGGVSSCAEKVPWNVLIEVKKITRRKSSEATGIFPYCGGVLITEKHILSAAHCFWTNQNQFGICPREFVSMTRQECLRQDCPNSCTRLGPSDIKVFLGVTNRQSTSSAEGKTISQIIIHEGWDRTQRDNDILAGYDIAMLTLKVPVDMLNAKTIPICLPTPSSDGYLLEKGRTGHVSGFGVSITQDSGARTHPAEVQTATVVINSKKNCQNWWGIEGEQICAAGTEIIQTTNSGTNFLADSCNGDSGGGLTTTTVEGRNVVIGIISFGEPECGRQGGKPGVYTNIMDHLDWIEKIISQSTSDILPSSNQDILPSSDQDRFPSSSQEILTTSHQDTLHSSSHIHLKTCMASNGKPCVFPFRVNKKLYPSCTTDLDPENRAWCSTKTDNQHNHIVGQDEYGYCSDNCGVNILTTPKSLELPEDSWGPWPACSKSCGGGSQTRRNILCVRSSSSCSQTRTCNNSPCPSLPSFSITTWSPWSTCSQTCGEGTRSRKAIICTNGKNICSEEGSIKGFQKKTCVNNPCFSSSTSSTSSISWSSWSTCDKRCGGGTQRRRQIGTNVVQTQGCNIHSCTAITSSGGGRPKYSDGTSRPKYYDGTNRPKYFNGTSRPKYYDGTSRPKHANYDNGDYRPNQETSSGRPNYKEGGGRKSSNKKFKTSWFIGGAGVGGGVESFVSTNDGNICGNLLTKFPTARSSSMGGYISGIVYVCGGSSSFNEYHNDCYAANANSPRHGWFSSQSMPFNTTNAPYAVSNNQLYIFGGAQKPGCGYKPEVQVYNPPTNQWTSRPIMDPPYHVGAYGCAVSTGDLIFVIGGWLIPEAYTPACKETLDREELRWANMNFQNYQSRVQVLNTRTGTWYQGPSLNVPRRNHGCTLVDVKGRKGIMVAGGYNSRDNYLKSVEFMDLGSSTPQLDQLIWRPMPKMKHMRSSLVLVESDQFVYAVAGNLDSFDTVERFHKSQARWEIQNYRTKVKRRYSTFIPNVQTNFIQC